MIRRLDPVADSAHLTTAWGWLQDSPAWYRQSASIFGSDSLDTYLYNARQERRIDVGVFEKGELAAIIGLTLRSKHCYEVQLDAAHSAPIELLVTAGSEVRDYMLSYGMQQAFAWLPRWNRSVKRILGEIGFTSDYLMMFRGKLRGRPIEWQRYSFIAPKETRNGT